MKKLLLSSAIALVMTTNVNADTRPETDLWLGGFAEYYSTDQSQSGAPDFLNDGLGFGAEIGLRFSPEWAVRLEFSDLNISASPADQSGKRLGVDGLYFLPDDMMYVFAGLKSIDIVDSDTVVNVGLGKHWDTDVSDNLKIITELAAYSRQGISNVDLGLKVGLSYRFGSTASAPVVTKPMPAPGPKDSDNDGVMDPADNCANTPAGISVDSYGCNADVDADGILNGIDACPNTPAGTVVGAKGCSLVLDTDQDGILDDVDQCTDTPMTDKVDANGCSVFVDEEVSINVNVLFGNNSSVIGNAGDAQFQELADFMNRYPATDAVIEGHASAPGAAAYNMMISAKRADSVKTLLTDTYGISPVRLTAKGFGETQLLDTSNTAEANKVNRRITARLSASKRVKVER
jgi:OOP family OmpA-OmpF porin